MPSTTRANFGLSLSTRAVLFVLRSYDGAGAVSRERAEMWLAYGSPQAVIDKMAAYLEAGCTTPVLRFVSPHPTVQLQCCIDEVLPAFRSR